MNDAPRAKKSLGQHWLYDPRSLTAMCDAASVEAGDTVLEVGPGTGTLTKQLLQRGAKVVAVEKDESLLPGLVQRFSSAQFEVHNKSILEFNLTTLPPSYKVVANIPYYLTSNLIRTLSESANPPKTAVLLIQKEVAQRVAAAPGAMSLLSVGAQYYWQVRLDREVPAHLFTPPPQVDSQILVLHRRRTPLFDQVDERLFFRIVKAGFSERRKTLHNSLSGGLRAD